MPTFWCDRESSFCIVEFGVEFAYLNKAYVLFLFGSTYNALHLQFLQTKFQVMSEASKRNTISWDCKCKGVFSSRKILALAT
jgi:hypothetical protein